MTALIASAAFLLGLVLGGQAPREAGAQTKAAAKPEGFTWKNDGKAWTFTNEAKAPYLIEVRLKKGSPALSPPLPVRTTGSVKVPVGSLDSVGVYRILAAALCTPNGCRPCDPIPGGDCPIPPRPPFNNPQDSLSTLYWNRGM